MLCNVDFFSEKRSRHAKRNRFFCNITCILPRFPTISRLYASPGNFQCLSNFLKLANILQGKMPLCLIPSFSRNPFEVSGCLPCYNSVQGKQRAILTVFSQVSTIIAIGRHIVHVTTAKEGKNTNSQRTILITANKFKQEREQGHISVTNKTHDISHFLKRFLGLFSRLSVFS